MKSSTFVLGSLLTLSVGLLTGCTMTGPNNLRVHEVTLYGGTQERIVWVYGDLSGSQSSLKLGGQTVDLRAQVSGDVLAVPGTLSVNGKATYRTPTSPTSVKFSLTRSSLGFFTVQPLNGAVLSAVYYTDGGGNWQKLSSLNGATSAIGADGLRGAGALTDAEGDALGRALSGQGPLAVAVLNEQTVTDPALTVEPAPKESLRTTLYVLPNIQTVAAAGGSTSGTVTITPGTGTGSGSTGTGSGSTGTGSLPSTPGNRVGFVEVASGTNAAVDSAGVRVAATQTALGTLYASAYGRQTGIPTAPRLNAGESVIGVFLGQRATGGYGIRIVNATAQNGVLTLTAEVSSPKAGSFTTQAITSPFTLIRLSGSYTQVRVVDTNGTLISSGQ